jgi:hypothetical protein
MIGQHVEYSDREEQRRKLEVTPFQMSHRAGRPSLAARMQRSTSRTQQRDSIARVSN